MNRPIKFRAWHKYPKLFLANEYLAVNGEGNFLLKQPIRGWIEFNCKDLVIQRSTGVKDGADKEIYEGDIVEHNRSDGRGIVTWDENDGCFYIKNINASWWDLFHDKRRWYDLEVVGNNLENPELLDKEYEIR